MKKTITILCALMVFNSTAQTTNVNPGFITNSTSTYTNTGFKGMYKSTMDTISFIGYTTSYSYLDTIILNQKYDTVTVKFNILLPGASSITLTINGITDVYDNGVPTSTMVTYSKTFINIDSLKYNVQVYCLAGSVAYLTKIYNQNVKLVKNVTSTGVNEIAHTISNLSVFPNPTNTDFKIKFNSNTPKAKIELFDIQGRLVMENDEERNIGANTSHISPSLVSGVYFLTFTDANNHRIVKKIIKE